MMAPRRTLTTIGLSLRDEMRVKSLLQIVEGKTAVPWMYIEETAADLALCEPDSALANLVIKQSARTGSPRCVMLLRQGDPCPADTACLFSPLGVREFIALLDGTKHTPPVEGIRRVEPPRPAEIASKPTLLEHLRSIASDTEGRTHHISIATLSVLVIPKRSIVLSTDALTPEHVTALAGGQDFEAEVLANPPPELAERHVHRAPFPVFLWNCAIAVDAAAESWLPRDASFSLKRWPDFGRFAHHPWHLRLTALMVREAFSTQQMSILVEQPASRIEAFLHACDLIGLLVTNHSSSSRRAASMLTPSAPQAASSGRWFSIFQSFRQALNMGRGRG